MPLASRDADDDDADNDEDDDNGDYGDDDDDNGDFGDEKDDVGDDNDNVLQVHRAAARAAPRAAVGRGRARRGNALRQASAMCCFYTPAQWVAP